jgi:two-component system chemotaxis sensor kinase CheA
VAARSSRPRSRRSKAYREFVSEAEEILERMRSDLSDLADQRADGGNIDPDLVNSLFRSAHSLKGLAGMFGLDGLSELAHHLEDILDGMRLGRVAMDSPAAILVDEATVLFAAELGDLGDPKASPGGSEAVAELIGRIDTAVREPAAEPGELAGLDLDPALLRALTEYEEHRLRENMRQGRHIVLVEATFEILSFDEGLAELSEAVRSSGEVLSTLPSPGAAPESQIRFGLLAASDLAAEALSAHIDFPHADVKAVWAPPGGEGDTAAARVEASQDASGPASDVAEAVPDVPTQEPAELESLKSISDTVRVDIRKLDELMNLVGELVIQRGAVAAVARRLLDDPATMRVGMDLDKIHKMLDRKVQELQAGVLEVRMVPLRQVFEKLSRVVRRLRRDMGKAVRLDLRGSDTELDKLIVEELVDPLMHIVRNAFDHAIESADERREAGKPEEGCIRIEASQRGNHVLIEVTDDGRGIDAEAVRRRAVERGLIRSEDSVSRRDILDLIFAPGFSTRDEVTETSGRGVGMDVVKNNLTALGGVVDLDSSAGRGTTVTLTLPITLAIIQALLVGVSDQRYAIPLNCVLETLLIDVAEIQRSEGREILNLRGEPLLLRRLTREFGLQESGEDKANVVVIGLGDMRLGLLVDRLDGQQDTVIKSVQGPVQDVRGIAGATEMGDLGAVLVLDMAALVEDAYRRRDAT